MNAQLLLQNYKAARALLLAAKENYAALRKMVRSECPDEWETIREFEKTLRIGPLGDRKKYNDTRRKAIRDAVAKIWSPDRAANDNVQAVHDHLAAMNIWSDSTTDHHWTILTAAERLGFIEDKHAA